MVVWSPIEVDGVLHDLSHLEPFAFDMVPQRWSKPATIAVAFNDHCFTEAFDPHRHAVRLRIAGASRHETRGFSPERWALSLGLPEIVRTLDGRRVARTRHGNLVHVRLADGRDYAVFFTLRRQAATRCGLFVVSAYAPGPATTPPAATGEMRFNTAVALVLEGKPLRFPTTRG